MPASGSNGSSDSRFHARRVWDESTQALLASVSRAASVGSPSARQCWSSRSGGIRWASLHNAPARIKGRRPSSVSASSFFSPSVNMPCGAYPAPDTSICRSPGSQMAVTVISFRVSVPVLSEQMTLVDPRVSTADSRRTIAPCFAMRCMPTDSAMVIATGRPSGTMETIWLMATMKMSTVSMPRIKPKLITATKRAIAPATR